jgi:D-xylose transport system permease protein
VSTADVDIVGQDHRAPEPDEETSPTNIRALYDRAVANLRSGNLGVVPIILGQIVVIIFFGYTATNFFTAVNFGNVIIQMAGTTMLAFGVVFVLLLGEIDLSIGYVAGIGALVVAELQLPGSGHQLNGLLAIVIAVAVCAVIGGVQGSIVAFVGVPSFVVTLAGFLIWQGVILGRLEVPGSIIIQDRWINYTANYYFSPLAGWVIAAAATLIYGAFLVVGTFQKSRAGVVGQNLLWAGIKLVGVAVALFGTVAICNHGVVQSRRLGLPLAGVLILIFLVVLTFLAKRTMFGRHVYAVGGNAEAARRAGINVPRIRVLVFMISGATAAVGGIILAAFVNSVALTFPPSTLLLNSIAAAVIGGVSLFGGRGDVRGALLGALLISTVSNGLNTAGYSNGTIYIVTGLILLLAVTLDTVARRLQARSGR